MTWLVGTIVVLLLVGIWDVVVQDEQRQRRARPPMGWLRRLLSRDGADRRRFARYRAAIPLTYRVLPAGSSVAGQTRDVSAGGVGLMLYEKLAPGTLVELTLRCDPPAKPLVVQGSVRWVREMPATAGDPKRAFWAGIQLAAAGTATVERLQGLLRQLAAERPAAHG